MKIAIITGASAGLGREFVRATVEREKTVEEIWLIARRTEKLEELARAYPQTRFKMLPFDLTDTESFAVFSETLEKERPSIELLINNAGMIGSGAFGDIDLKRQENMIALNMKAPMELIYRTLPRMKAGSRIINVCSVAGFAPTPNMITYSATKACLFSFTKGLRQELKERKINVLALCPGNMKTEMFSDPTSPSEHKSIVNLLPFLDMEKVTRKSLELVKRGRGIYTPHIVYKCYRLIAKFIPHEWLMKISKV
ncbi:SDR family NAD(P)-dependent oxidoreductase [Sporolactobacillus sp. CPB3-1]|uniref:SDR family NAD(P)-dependent oxidoreductase n=1 Tax=Sporolactobacillus mangiferae TaxID=2940498 RepID=A0ABT0MEK9_9BACL|nr:SDR family NAD(P)-dependent oxidoreductase [Sporolactobacillus mangiferae]MCL1632755.1 SDR family NAD(P)-dependent oxidoreductase [Sporolactobacillus mangiferae]